MPHAFQLLKRQGIVLDLMETSFFVGRETIVPGPGGYKFGDYWRLGLPLSILVVVVGSSLLLLFWPLK